MSSRVFAVGLVLALVIHLAGAQTTPHLIRYVDLFLVVTVLNAVGGNSLRGLLGGLAAGWLFDALTGGLYGLFGFADSVVGYATARVAQRLETQSSGSLLLMLALATLAQQLVVVLLLLTLQPQGELPGIVEAGIRVATTAAVGLLAWYLMKRVTSRRADHRRRRRSRIRL